MELLNVVMARAIWLFDINELNPRGKSIFPDLLDWLKEGYGFEKVPSSVTDVDETKALTFSRGSFQVKEEIFVTAELKIYNDGLIANTWSSTRDAEAFLTDILKSASEEFSLVFKPEVIRKKMYLSELHVASILNLINVNPKLDEFSEKISRLSNHGFEFAGLSFWPRQSIPPTTKSAFTFERKVNTDRDEHKYFSRAPFHTDEHLRLLEELEQAFMG
jgi:hypothetical protein